MHRAGVIHGNIRLTNIVCDSFNGPYKLTNIQLVAPNMHCLGADYFSLQAPEVLNGQAHDQFSDVWSFGIVMF